MTHLPLLSAIVAGGASSRFGSDKALALLDGQPLIAHAHAALERCTGAIVVCGRAWGSLPMLEDLPVPGLGPLGGIAAALAYAQANGFGHVLTIACDMPGVPGTLLTELIARAPAYCSDAPILGCWPIGAAQALAARLAGHRAGVKDGALSIRRWAESIEAAAVAAPVALFNVNTPADLPA